jgi:hypothetical protein
VVVPTLGARFGLGGGRLQTGATQTTAYARRRARADTVFSFSLPIVRSREFRECSTLTRHLNGKIFSYLGHVYMPPRSRLIDIDVQEALPRPLIKLSLTRKPSPRPWHCVCNAFGGQDNYKGETGLSPITRKLSCSPKCQHDPGLGLHADARGHAAA